MFPRTDLAKKNAQNQLKSRFDINLEQSRHVETVVLLSRKTPDDVIEVDLDLDELDRTASESQATYPRIKEYVFWKFWSEGFQCLYCPDQAQMRAGCGPPLQSYLSRKMPAITPALRKKSKPSSLRWSIDWWIKWIVESGPPVRDDRWAIFEESIEIPIDSPLPEAFTMIIQARRFFWISPHNRKSAGTSCRQRESEKTWICPLKIHRHREFLMLYWQKKGAVYYGFQGLILL